MNKSEKLSDPAPVDPLWEEFNSKGKQTQLGPELAVDKPDLGELFTGYTYMCRLNLVDSGGISSSIVSVVDGLKDMYGAENVVVSAVSIDPDTQEKVEICNGVVGVWVKSEAKADTDKAQHGGI